MKFTIMGFSQEKLMELDMDLQDCLIVRWFIDFKDTDKMYSEIAENDKFYWIKYESLLKDIPILKIEKVTLGRRLKKLSEKGILKQYIKKQGGTYTLYTIGKEYTRLVSTEGCTQKSIGGVLESTTGIDEKVQTKNYSIKEINLLKNQSIKESKTSTAEIENFFEECWKLYPSKTGKGTIKDKAKKETYKLGEEFKRCIERYIEFVEQKRKKDFPNLNWKNGSTFWNSGYIDFLDENYKNINTVKSREQLNKESEEQYGF